MAYSGTQNPGLPELTSQRRLREAMTPVAEPGVKGMKWGAKKGGGDAKTEGRVHVALDNALANDFDLRRNDPREVAEDLVQNDAELEDEDPKDLVTHIKSWQKAAVPTRGLSALGQPSPRSKSTRGAREHGTERKRSGEAGVKGMKWGAKKGAGGTLMVDPKSKLGKAHTAVSREMADSIQARMKMGNSKREIGKMLKNPKLRKAYGDMGVEHGLDRKTATKMANSLADQHIAVL